MRHESEQLDVTFVLNDEREIRAHKFLMSVHSPKLRKLFSKYPGDSPVLLLGRFDYHQVQKVVDFVYTGSVEIEETNLQEFLAIGKDLEIMGLSDAESSHPSSSKH